METAKAPTLRSYWDCLVDNPHYRNLWIAGAPPLPIHSPPTAPTATPPPLHLSPLFLHPLNHSSLPFSPFVFTADFIDNIGAWLSYVATLELVESFSGGSGLALSAVILIRFAPSLLLSPLAGVLADRCNRVIILVIAAIADAVLVAALVAVRTSAQTPLLFALLAAQFTAIALQDPARRAIVPVLVRPPELHLATTLETFSWSLTGAVGAALGGTIASRLGREACFLIDACTYLTAAWFATRVPRTLGDPQAMEKAAAARKARRSSGAEPPGAIELAEAGSGGSSGEGLHLHAADHRKVHHSSLDSANNNQEKEKEHSHLLPHHPPSSAAPPPMSVQSLATAAWEACVEGWSAAVEGGRYLAAPENRDVALLVTMKGCGSLTWGAVDVLNVKFSELPSMQIRDSATTLGFIFACVGLGCFGGPLVMNPFVPPRPGPLLWACAGAFCCLFAGSTLMALAHSLAALLGATLVRAVGSATLWIYSTLLLQLRCPNAILGRVSAAEMALYTIAEAASATYGGAAFDLGGMSVSAVTASLAVVAGGVAVWWLAYAARRAWELEAAAAAEAAAPDGEGSRLLHPVPG